MATTVRSLLNRAAALLSDEEFVRWEESELLEWLNDGQKVIARGPASDVYVLRDNITCAAGSVQNMPEDNLRLVDVIKNVSSGRAIVQADYAMADILRPSWRAGNTGEAENYFYDERNPQQFEVYPPQVGGELLEIVYNADPPPAQITGNLIINDVFADAVLDYMVYRALSKDTEDTATETRKANTYYQSFLVGAGFKDATDIMIEPRRS
jgi:hypothetical protein